MKNRALDALRQPNGAIGRMIHTRSPLGMRAFFFFTSPTANSPCLYSLDDCATLRFDDQTSSSRTASLLTTLRKELADPYTQVQFGWPVLDSFMRKNGFYECTDPIVGSVFLHGKNVENMCFYIGVKSYLPQFMNTENLAEWKADWKVPLLSFNSPTPNTGKATVCEPGTVYQTVNMTIHLEPE